MIVDAMELILCNMRGYMKQKDITRVKQDRRV